MKKQTIKLLFISPDVVQIDQLSSGIKDLPIIIVAQFGLEQAYVVDTGIEVTKKNDKKQN